MYNVKGVISRENYVYSNVATNEDDWMYNYRRDHTKENLKQSQWRKLRKDTSSESNWYFNENDPLSLRGENSTRP